MTTRTEAKLANTSVILLPSDTTKLIFQYEPAFRVTAVIPAKKRKVKVTRSPHDTHLSAWTEETEISTPTTLFSCNLDYGATSKEKDFSRLIVNTFSVWAVDDTVKEEIRTANYTIGNIHPGGRICFGSVIPKTLRQANNLFWEIPFTDHMWDQKYVNCNCKIKKHIAIDHEPAHNYNKHAPIHTCKCSKDIFHRHSCLGWRVQGQVKEANSVTSKIKSINKELKSEKITVEVGAQNLIKFLEKKIEAKYGSTAGLGKPENLIKGCTCCQSLLNETNTCNINCHQRHKISCQCVANFACGCPCPCDCCNKKCKCKCSCACCQKICNCPCDCKKTKFVEHIKAYDFTKNLKWSNATTTICGSKYWAKSATAAGLLLTQAPEILELVPAKYRKKYSVTKDSKKEEKEFIIALGNPKEDEWEFTIGDFKFSLPSGRLSLK